MPAKNPPRNPLRALTTTAVGLVFAALVATSLAVPATADPVDRSDEDPTARQVDGNVAPKTLPDKWFVQVSGAPSLRGGNRAAATRRQASVQTAARDHGSSLSVLHTYTRVWNGFSVKASRSTVENLLSLPGVTAIYPVAAVQQPDRSGLSALKNSLSMIGADLAQSAGLTGEGIKVGIINSGIDYNHPDLGGSGTPGNNNDFGPSAPRVKYGYDFVGDNYSPGVPGREPVPDAFPDDCAGWGTGLAGVIGGAGDPADGHVRGVAPQVTFGAYRVWGCAGATDTEVILAAMDRAAADHMDVVTTLLPGSSSWPGSPIAEAASALTDAGTLVVAPNGGGGSSGLFSSSVARKVISVASVNSADITLPWFSVSPAPAWRSEKVGYLEARIAPPTPTSGTSQLAVPPAGDAQGCGRLSGLTGRIVLIQVGDCDVRGMALSAMDAGAAGVVIYSDSPNPVVFPELSGPRTLTIPMVGVSQADGEALAAQVAAGRATTLTWKSGVTPVPNPLGGLVSANASFGMAADLTLTPDLAAPGDNVWSTFPIEKNSYASAFGTSGASAAGAVALMLQAARLKHVDLQGDVARVRAALQNTARPVSSLNLFGRVTKGVYEPTIRQGAGVIQVDKAIAAALTGTSVAPGQISLGENVKTYRETRLTLTNRGTKAETYKLSVQHAASVGPRPTNYWYGSVSRAVPATFSASTVTVQPGRTATVSVSLRQPVLTTGWIYGGWVKLTRTDNNSTLVVPFAGMWGDYQSVKVLQDGWAFRYPDTPAEPIHLPALSTSASDSGIVSPSGPKPVFTMQDADSQPHLLYHFDYPVNNAYFNVYKATADGRKGAEVFPGRTTFLELGKVGRTEGALGNQGLPNQVFNGKIPFAKASTAGLTVPNGDYVLELRVLKALGNPSVASNWETYTSPAFTIRRTTP